MGTFTSISTFKHERTPMYVYSDSMPSNHLTANKLTNILQQITTDPPPFKAQVLMAHNTLNSCKHGARSERSQGRQESRRDPGEAFTRAKHAKNFNQLISSISSKCLHASRSFRESITDYST